MPPRVLPNVAYPQTFIPGTGIMTLLRSHPYAPIPRSPALPRNPHKRRKLKPRLAWRASASTLHFTDGETEAQGRKGFLKSHRGTGNREQRVWTPSLLLGAQRKEAHGQADPCLPCVTGPGLPEAVKSPLFLGLSVSHQ